MPKYNKPINSFSSGELGPKTISRYDIDEYSQGAELVQNLVPYKSGGVTRRPRTKHLAQVTTALGSENLLAGLYPFIFSQTEAYCVVITPDNNAPDAAIQVFKRDGSNSDVTYNTGGTNYFTLPNFDSSLDVNGFQYAQSGDVLYFVHSSGTYPPFVVKRLDTDSFEVQHIWGLGEVYQPALTNAYQDSNTDPEKWIYFDLTTTDPYKIQRISLSQRTMYSVDSSGTPINTIFKQEHVGSIWRVTDLTVLKEAVVFVEAVAGNLESCTVRVLIGVGTDLAGVGNRSDNWKAPEWSDDRGWPRSISFFQQRLVFGGSIASPDTIWFSKVANYRAFMSDRLDQDILAEDSGLLYSGEITNADGFNATIASTEINDIVWLSAETVLVCGTIGAEYTLAPIDGIFGRNNINVTVRSSYGSQPVQAFKGGEGVVYISRDGKRVRRFKYSIETGEQNNFDLTTLNSDIVYHNPNLLGTTTNTEFKSITVKQMAWQESRSTMWFVTSNKALLGFTIDNKSGVAGWHRHEISPANGNQAEILGVTVLPNLDNTYMEVYVLVSRLVWVSTEISLEKIGDDFEHTLLKNNSTAEDDHPHFSDSSVRYTAAEASATRTFDQSWVDPVENTITFKGKHRYHQGQEVRVSTSGTMPGGLSQVTDYYLIVESDKIIRLADSPANAATGKSAAVDITGTGIGIHSIVPTAVSTLTRWSGLNHLSNEPCRILLDGVEADDTVDVRFELFDGIGEYIDTIAAEEIIIGLPYKSKLKSMPLETGGPGGSVSRGNITRINRADIMFYKTWDAKFGSEDDNLEDVPLNGETFSGDQILDFSSSPDRLGQVIVETDSALPMSILGMTLRGQDNQG